MLGRIISQSSSSSVEAGVEGLRVCKSWVRGRRVCLIFFVDDSYEIFLVDRDSEDNLEMNVRPSLRIPIDFGSFSFCVVDGVLYAFRIGVNSCSSKEEEIFKVNLSRPGMQFADLMEKVPFMCKPKSEGLPLVWGKKIFLFSTLIMFYNCVHPEERDNIFDFEVFDPSTLQSVLLPPLLIFRPKKFGAWAFFNKGTSELEELPTSGVGSFPVVGSCPDPYFRIQAYGFGGLPSRFSMQTEFGHTFSIDLSMQDPNWSYSDDKFLQSGLNFIHIYRPPRALFDTRRALVDASVRAFVDARGINCTSGLGKTIYYPFPLSSFDCYRSAINVLDRSPSMIGGDIFGIVRVGPDASCCRDEYVPPTTLDWCLDVLKISRNPTFVEESGPHVEIMKSWKFSTVDKHVIGTRIIGLFSY